jgi:hypothetical protein
MGGDVYVPDPFHRVTGPAEAYRSAFNPLAGLNPDTDDGLDLAGQIADALVVQQKGRVALDAARPSWRPRPLHRQNRTRNREPVAGA